MTWFVKMLRAAAKYRPSTFEIGYIGALLAISLLAKSHANAVSVRGDPRIAATDSALARLISTVDMTTDAIDPRVRALTERRLDLASRLDAKITFWRMLRVVFWFLFLSAVVVEGVSFVRRVVTGAPTDGERVVRRS